MRCPAVLSLASLVSLVAGCDARAAAKRAAEEAREERANEAVLELGAIGKAVRLFEAEADDDRLPIGHAALTPATPCCQHPDHLCPGTGELAAWSAEPWNTLDFELEEPHRFQYSYDSDGTTFTATAVGDLDPACHGDLVTLTLRGHVDDTAVVLELDNPLRPDPK